VTVLVGEPFQANANPSMHSPANTIRPLSFRFVVNCSDREMSETCTSTSAFPTDRSNNENHLCSRLKEMIKIILHLFSGCQDIVSGKEDIRYPSPRRAMETDSFYMSICRI